ncbi:MAG: hypothetical protein PHW02_08660 [bacterium]|nr:hypothetical protein [bacterium]
MKRWLVFGLIVLATLNIHAVMDQELANGNNIGGYISNFGVMFQDGWTGNSGLYWPKTYPEQTYIFGSGMWFGGLLDTAYSVSGVDTTWFTDTLLTCGFEPMTEFVSGDSSDNPSPYTMEEFHVYKSNDYDWPFDTILSDFDTYCIFNDLDHLSHFSWEDKPLKIVVEQFTYQFNATPVKDVIFLRYRVINRNALNIRNGYLAFNVDIDIGNEADAAANDLLGFIADEEIAYQFQLESEPGWVTDPGVVGWTYVQGPVATDTVDVYHDGSEIIMPGDTIGMTSFRFFTIATDPSTKEKRYVTVAGYNHVTYNPADPEASYEPFPSWGTGVAGYPGETMDSSLAADKRFIISSGPFDLASYDTVDVVLAVAVNITPDSMVNSLRAAKEWWKRRATQSVNLVNPADNETISNPTSFTWNASIPLPQYTLSMVNRESGEIKTFSGTNTLSHLLDPAVLEDGIYSWRVSNFDSLSVIASNEKRHFLVNNPAVNGRPCIYEYFGEIQNVTALLRWKVVDPEGELEKQRIEIRNFYGDMVYSYDVPLEYSSLSINASRFLTSGTHTARIIVADVVGEADTAEAILCFENQLYQDSLTKVTGDGDALEIDYLIYDARICEGKTYYVSFGYPYFNDSLDLPVCPFIVSDSATGESVLADSALLDNETYYAGYYSKIFNGVGLCLNFTKGTMSADSIKILNDVNDNYPDSVLLLERSYNDLFGGRDIRINWHEKNDSLYADFIPEGSQEPLPYMPYYGAGYFYGSYSDPTDYIFTSTTSRVLVSFAGLKIYFNYTTRANAMDINWAPEEGEVWMAYASGLKLPIKGDVYKFTPIVQKTMAKKSSLSELAFSCSLNDKKLCLLLAGSSDTLEIAMYDVQGREVKKIFKGIIDGRREFTVNLNLKNGIYFIKEKKGKFPTQKMVMIK